MAVEKSNIEWTESTWSPVTGCTEVSPGCDHCYAKTFAERWRGVAGHPYENGFDVQLRPERLDQPIRWKRGRRIFVNSMSDLFHDAIPDDYIAEVFGVMAGSWWHEFQVLTKRHGRMRSLLSRPEFREQVARAGARRLADGDAWFDYLMFAPQAWPLPNVWGGVSVEDDHWARIRIPALLETPLAVRFLSIEPMLGPVDLAPYLWRDLAIGDVSGVALNDAPGAERYVARDGRIGWVIVGAESGHGARPMDEDWARTVKDACVAAAVPFFLKQYAENGRKIHVPELDGQRWEQYPKRPPQISSPAFTLL